MKKILLTAIAAVLCTATAKAGSLLWDTSAPDGGVTVGARLGWNFATMAGKGSHRLGTRKGVALGAGVDVNLMRSFSVNTGLMFTMKGCKAEYTSQVGDMLGVRYEMTQAVNFLELPVYASWHMNFAPGSDLQVFAGPYFDLGIYGKMGTKQRDSDGYSSAKAGLFSKNQGYRRLGAGLGLGTSYTWGGRYVVGLQYQWGLSKTAHLMDNQWNCLQLSLGYNIL